MVWGLFPVDSLRGAQNYYIFSEGKFQVGRKDCHIVVQTDTSVSRLHAEIFVDKMALPDHSHTRSKSFSSSARVVDRSKFGTVVNKELGTKEIKLHKDQDATLKEEDLVTFGTGNATFRFCFIPIIIFIHASKGSKVDPSLKATISSIGACSISNWSTECTHVLVNESSPVSLDIIEAVVTKKPVVRSEWLKLLAEKSIRTEFPSCLPCVPTLNLEGTFVRVVDPEIRDKCLGGFTFVLGSSLKYKFGDKFQSLLEVVGGKFLTTDEFCSNSQTSEDGENDYVLVVPGASPNEFNHFKELSSLSRVTDLKLVASILSGNFESSIMEPPSIIVSSSHSTDETVVADSEVEMDTATTDHAATTTKIHVAIDYEHLDQEEKSEDREGTRSHQDCTRNSDYPYASSDNIKIPSPKEDVVSMEKIDKGKETFADRHENSDIIFCRDLIVRKIAYPVPDQSTKQVVNFKRFKKMKTVSGNTFKDLIPFSKDPYEESNESEYTREEKKRKQMEAIAEDLFNNQKVKKRSAAGGSLEAFLARC